MAFATQNDFAIGRKPAVSPAGSELIAQTYVQTFATADLVANKTGAIGWMPAGCVPVYAIVESTDMDTGSATLAFALGIVKDDETNLDGTAWATGLNHGQAGTSGVVVLARAALGDVANKDRKLGLKVTTGAATAAAGSMAVTIFYKAA